MASSSNEADFYDNDSLDLEDSRESKNRASDEDTEDASEAEEEKKDKEYTGIKEEMYKIKMDQLKKQVRQLKEGTLPGYIRKLKKLDQHHDERLNLNRIWARYEKEIVEMEFQKEKMSAQREFEERKVELKENLILDLEHKKKAIENERNTMELTGDTMTVKPVTTRKLRRRPNDPAPVPEKRGKPSPIHLIHELEENGIYDDIQLFNKVLGKSASKTTAQLPTSLSHPESQHDVYIEDGRIYYEKKCFHRDQSIVIESKEQGKISAVITAVGVEEFYLKKSDNSKLRVTVGQLQKGQYIIKRKPS